MAWRRFWSQNHSLNFLGVSTLAALRSAVGFGPSIHDRKLNEMIIESDGEQFASVSLKGKKSSGKWKPYNQDAFFYRILDGIRLFGVCDGHGPKGHNVSHHIAEQISDYVERTEHEPISSHKLPDEWLQDIVAHTVDDMEQRTEIETKRSGSTLVFSYIDDRHNVLYTANVGDSRAIVVYRDMSTDWMLSTKQLNVEHSPKVPEEVQRIVDNGGYVGPRGYVSHSNTPYGINMTRSLGDDDIHWNDIVSSDPDIMRYQITPQDICFVHGTDGVWDVMDNQEAAAIISNNLPDFKQAAIEIVNECELRWRKYAGRVDDITITIYALNDGLVA